MLKRAISLAALLLAAGTALAQDQVVNLYSARHYATDEALYSNFTKATGIKINRVDAGDADIIARLKAEGTASPADVILLVDAARLYRGEVDGLFQPIRSKLLEDAIPSNLRSQPAADGGISWWGFSAGPRDRLRQGHAEGQRRRHLREAGLASAQGQDLHPLGLAPYNLSLFGAVTEHMGETRAEEWLKGIVANLARDPKGGDTDQIKGVASGECGVGVTNSYYLARLMRSTNPADRSVAEKVGVVFPNQGSWGTHLNIAGGAVARYAKNQGNAIKLLEYLASPEAQNYFANGNNEWPTAKGVKVDNPALAAMVPNGFKSETIPIGQVGAHQLKVQQMLDRVGFK